MTELNLPTQIQEGSWDHAPPGCFGADENGGSFDINTAYFNNNQIQSNFEFDYKYRSVCKIGNFKIINQSVLLKMYAYKLLSTTQKSFLYVILQIQK